MEVQALVSCCSTIISCVPANAFVRGCVTPKIIENINEFLEGNMELLEGYEALDEAWQDKITKALEQGHVDDRDWTGDLEFNRPGKTGKFPRAKKGKKAADTDAEDSEAKPTPKKKAPAKKRKAKVEEDKEDEEVEEDAKPAPKKRKSAATKAKVEPETDGGDAVKPTKRGPGRPKKPEGTGKAKPSVPHGRPRGRPKMPEGTTKPAYVPNGRPRFGRAE